jgi:hypothetical protein
MALERVPFYLFDFPVYFFLADRTQKFVALRKSGLNPQESHYAQKTTHWFRVYSN